MYKAELVIGWRYAASLLRLLLHIPNIIANPKDVLMWALAFRDLAFSGGALAFAGTQTEKWHAEGTCTLITFARIFVSVPAIFFGAEHFLHPEFLPGVDLDHLTLDSRARTLGLPCGHHFYCGGDEHGSDPEDTVGGNVPRYHGSSLALIRLSTYGGFQSVRQRKWT